MNVLQSTAIKALAVASLAFTSAITEIDAETPRVVNIINFIRQTEPRAKLYENIAWITDSVLYATVEHQVELANRYQLPSSYLLQYDALINPDYQNLLKEKPIKGSEIGAWWEITEPHVKDAGLEWRGRFPWDWHANVGFSVGYTPEQREKLVDTYMAKFKEVFGYYPKSVASWFIDSHSLRYMQEKYDIEASAACKEQIGTDGYNLWGGYWQGGYYPSVNNFHVPAQTAENQINVPVFRLLGSDPIAQYDSGMGGGDMHVITLEPVYEEAGGSPEWCDWYFNTTVHDPAMTFVYFQAGQENMFTWPAMKDGLEYQYKELARLARQGDIVLETLGETGHKFLAKYPKTPSSAIATLGGYKNPKQKSIWFNSADYRLNLIWEGNRMFVRDIHLFDENQKELYLDKPCVTEDCHYITLPVVDGNVWSSDADRCALRFYTTGEDGEVREISFGTPDISHIDEIMTVDIPITDFDGGKLRITLDDKHASFRLSNNGEKSNWFAALRHSPYAKLPFTHFSPKRLSATFNDYEYNVNIDSGSVASSPDEGTAFILSPDNDDTIILNFSK